MALLSLLFVFLSFRNAAMKLKKAFNQKSQDDFIEKLLSFRSLKILTNEKSPTIRSLRFA